MNHRIVIGIEWEGGSGDYLLQARVTWNRQYRNGNASRWVLKVSREGHSTKPIPVLSM